MLPRAQPSIDERGRGRSARARSVLPCGMRPTQRHQRGGWYGGLSHRRRVRAVPEAVDTNRRPPIPLPASVYWVWAVLVAGGGVGAICGGRLAGIAQRLRRRPCEFQGRANSECREKVLSTQCQAYAHPHSQGNLQVSSYTLNSQLQPSGTRPVASTRIPIRAAALPAWAPGSCVLRIAGPSCVSD